MSIDRFTRARAGLEEAESSSEMNHVVVASATCVCMPCVKRCWRERKRKMQVGREGRKVFPVEARPGEGVTKLFCSVTPNASKRQRVHSHVTSAITILDRNDVGFVI